MKILLDLDGVCADFMGELIKRYNYETGEKVLLTDIKTNKTSRYFKKHSTFYRLMTEPGFIYSLKPIPGAIDSIKKLLLENHDIVFVSNATNGATSGHEKRNWLKFHFGSVWKYPPLVLTKQKWHVRGDVLLDDNPINFINLHQNTKPLLFSQPYNLDITEFDVIKNWNSFLDWVSKQDGNKNDFS